MNSLKQKYYGSIRIICGIFLFSHPSLTYSQSHILWWQSRNTIDADRANERILELTKEIDSTESNPELFYMRSLLRMMVYSGNSGLKLSALADIDKAIALDTANAVYYVQKAQILMDLDSVDLCVNAATAAIGLSLADDSASLSIAHYIRGMQLTKKGVFEDARGDFNNSVRLAKEYPLPYQGRGALSIMEGKYEEAIEDFAMAAKHGLTAPTLDADIGMALENLGRHDEALQSYSRAIAKNKKEPMYWRRRLFLLSKLAVQGGDSYAMQLVSDASSALRMSEAESSLASSRNAFHLMRGLGYFYLEEYEDAFDEFSIIVESKPDEAEYWKLRAKAASKIGESKQAIHDLQRSVELNPNDKDTHFLLGYTYLDAKYFGMAIESFTRAIVIDKNYANAIYLRGYSYALMGDTEKACEDFRRAASLGAKGAEGYVGKNCN